MKKKTDVKQNTSLKQNTGLNRNTSLKRNTDGTVNYTMKAGKDIVKDRMPYEKAMQLKNDPKFEFEKEKVASNE